MASTFFMPMRSGITRWIIWPSVSGPFLESVAIGDDGLFEARGAGRARAEHLQCIAEIVLSLRPIERRPLAGPFLEGVVISGDGLFETRGATLAPAKHREH